MARCLTDSQLVLFLEARLPTHEATAVEAHLDGCSVCRQVVAAMVRSSSPGAGKDSRAEPARAPVSREYSTSWLARQHSLRSSVAA